MALDKAWQKEHDEIKKKISCRGYCCESLSNEVERESLRPCINRMWCCEFEAWMYYCPFCGKKL